MRNPSSVSRRIESRSARDLAQRRLVEQQAGRGLVAAADAAAQLVQLGEAEALGMLDHHDRRVRHVDADLDHRRRHQRSIAGAGECGHRPGPCRRPSCGRGPARPGPAAIGSSAAAALLARRRGRCPRIPRPAGRSSRPSRLRRGRGRPRRPPRRGGRAAWCGCRSAGGRAAFRSAARCRDRHRRSSSGCAGSASRSSPGCRRRGPLSASARRCSTPKRCCSSMTASARSRNATSGCNSAWVPTTIEVRPEARPASSASRGRPFSRPVSSATSTPGRRGEALQRRVVLAGQHLGRRHQRRLRAALDRDQHRQQRDHGLAAADIALQQPHHLRRRRHVGGDLGDRQALRSRSAQSRARPRPCAASAPGALDGAAAAALAPRAHQRDRELAGEHLVIGEPLARRGRGRQIGLAGGRVGRRRAPRSSSAICAAAAAPASIHSGSSAARARARRRPRAARPAAAGRRSADRPARSASAGRPRRRRTT